jgi:hypothetical protein
VAALWFWACLVAALGLGLAARLLRVHAGIVAERRRHAVDNAAVIARLERENAALDERIAEMDAVPPEEWAQWERDLVSKPGRARVLLPPVHPDRIVWEAEAQADHDARLAAEHPGMYRQVPRTSYTASLGNEGAVTIIEDEPSTSRGTRR